MNKDVLITMKSIQTIDNDSNETELITQAVYEPLADGGFRISYDETDATGFLGAKTVLSCYGNRRASICRSGIASSNLVIDREKKQHCHYGTPYGELMVGIYTHAIINKLSENGGDLYMKYTIDINSSHISDNEIYINVRPAGGVYH